MLFEIIDKYIKINAAEEDLCCYRPNETTKSDIKNQDSSTSDKVDDVDNNDLCKKQKPKNTLNGKMIKHLLRQIDFTNFSALEYVDGPGESVLLSDSQKLIDLKSIIRSTIEH